MVAQRAETGPHEAADGMAHRFAHPPHLAVAALVDDDLQGRTGRGRLGEMGFGRSGAAVVEVDALPEAAESPRLGTPVTSAR